MSLQRIIFIYLLSCRIIKQQGYKKRGTKNTMTIYSEKLLETTLVSKLIYQSVTTVEFSSVGDENLKKENFCLNTTKSFVLWLVMKFF